MALNLPLIRRHNSGKASADAAAINRTDITTNQPQIQSRLVTQPNKLKLIGKTLPITL
ncbi:hypothetical protein [Pseudoalteromonas aurantia]|uniref:hypothetical protein n=1 Tax=Pseudoalteromonas aurantia TaxID=43654 RepID=UPI0014861647|nr:hypothetical protein [Pseudoalteromonas aurantia]